MTWLSAPLWGTLSYIEAAWLLLTLGCVVYLVGQARDARAQLRAAQDPVERWLAESDAWLEAKEILIQCCFGAVGLYGALTPPAPLDPGRALGALGATTLLMAVQVTNLVAVRQRLRTRQRITAELRRQARAAVAATAVTGAAGLLSALGATPRVGGKRRYDKLLAPESETPS